ncbi:glycoside hydrolase family 18 protein [Jaapia argillacea MUCL 33604]|uniref:chitinase n=1 Tax=Jaapia argillacea MUCL 33604 TaxID=933084 RepID=A0A067Q6A8_9AGAM|nr:glycoside hydrolase family 18 protein [Jaapia argillacea MUCL 33604]
MLLSIISFIWFITVSILSGRSLAAPIPHTGLSITAREILANSTISEPHFLIYSDKYISGVNGAPNASDIQGYNVFSLSFLMLEGAWDKAQEWTTLSAAERKAVKAEYDAAGIKLIVSLFGSTDAPTTSGADPVATASTMAAWVKKYDLDGVDVDYEDFDAFDAATGAAEQWIISFTTELRNHLPSGQFIITHAPVAPWFSPKVWGGGGYLLVDQKVGSMIDWYNVQFYNQGSTEYTTCSGLLTNSSSTWPESSIFEIAANGVPLNKLVIGKPATQTAASNGYVDPDTLADCVDQAVQKGWSAGVMVWEFPDAGSPWIETVRGDAFPGEQCVDD